MKEPSDLPLVVGYIGPNPREKGQLAFFFFLREKSPLDTKKLKRIFLFVFIFGIMTKVGGKDEDLAYIFIIKPLFDSCLTFLG